MAYEARAPALARGTAISRLACATPDLTTDIAQAGPNWFNSYLCSKNTFLEISAPLAETATGFSIWRRQTSEPCLHRATQGPLMFPNSEDNWLEQLKQLTNSDKQRVLPDTGSSSLLVECETMADKWSQSDCAAPSIQTEVSEQLVPDFPEVATSGTDAGDSTSTSPSSNTTPRGLSTSGSIGQIDTQATCTERMAEWSAMQGVPLDEDGNPTSEGSLKHFTGTCRPCAFKVTRSGCDAGLSCRFCHFSHPEANRIRARPCKGKRDRIRKLVGKICEQIDNNPYGVGIQEHMLPPSLKADARSKARLYAQITRHAEKVHSWRAVSAWDGNGWMAPQRPPPR